MTTEHRQEWVCGDCMILVANGDDSGASNTEALMSLLSGNWHYVGHSWDDCPECAKGNWADVCPDSDGEASRWWTCAGCGDTPGMFAGTFLIEKW